MAPASAPYTSDKIAFGLDHGEVVWRHLQPWLQSIGYMLRPRYHPGWVPPWQSAGDALKYPEEMMAPSVSCGLVRFVTR